MPTSTAAQRTRKAPRRVVGERRGSAPTAPDRAPAAPAICAAPVLPAASSPGPRPDRDDPVQQALVGPLAAWLGDEATARRTAANPLVLAILRSPCTLNIIPLPPVAAERPNAE